MQGFSLPFKPTDKVLEIGCGDNPVRHDELWHTMDSRKLPTVDIVGDANDPLPVADESYEGVYSSFLLEHLRLPKLRGFLSEIHRILKPSGIAIIITSNLLDQCKVIIERDAKGQMADDLIQMVFGGNPDYAENYHHSSLTPKYCADLFKQAGFGEVSIYEHPVAIQIMGKSTDMIVQAKRSGAKIMRGL